MVNSVYSAGVPLIKAGFETPGKLVINRSAAECCMNELIVDLMYEGGMSYMRIPSVIRLNLAAISWGRK